MSIAWHTAAFGRMKKMPKLADVLPSEPKKPSRIKRPVMPDEVRAWLSKSPKKRR